MGIILNLIIIAKTEIDFREQLSQAIRLLEWLDLDVAQPTPWS